MHFFLVNIAKWYFDFSIKIGSFYIYILYISVGKGVEFFFSDVVINYLINAMKPRLRKEEYGVALQELLVEIDMILSGKRSNTEIELAMKRERSYNTGVLVFTLIFISLRVC